MDSSTIQVEMPKKPSGKVTNHLLRVAVTCKGITPLLMNRVDEEALLKIRDKIKEPKNAPKKSPHDEAAGKVYQDSKEKPYLPTSMLYSSLVAAGQYVRLDGKRQVSTAKSTTLPSFMTIQDATVELKTPGWETDIRQGRNPNGGEIVVLCRPRFDVWEFTVNIMIDTSEIAEETIRNIFDISGRRCGIGDFRPNRKGIFGQFVVQCWERLNAK